MAAPTKEMKFCKANFDITEKEGQFFFERVTGTAPGYVVDMEQYPTIREASAWVWQSEQTPIDSIPDNFDSFPSLMSVASKYPTDKIQHGYIEYYEKHLPKDINSLFEIGCYKGDSIRMWREFYPDAQIGCLDLFEEFGIPDITDVKFFKGDQCYPDVVEPIAAMGWDVVIDDGSHGAKDQWLSLNTFLRPGTMVVIEDLHCNQESFFRQGLTYDQTILGMMKSGDFPYRFDLYEVKKGSIIAFVYAD
jgi:hypothetical protein